MILNPHGKPKLRRKLFSFNSLLRLAKKDWTQEMHKTECCSCCHQLRFRSSILNENRTYKLRKSLHRHVSPFWRWNWLGTLILVSIRLKWTNKIWKKKAFVKARKVNTADWMKRWSSDYGVRCDGCVRFLGAAIWVGGGEKKEAWMKRFTRFT